MENFITDKKIIDLILDHGKWNIISSILPKEHQPFKDDKYMNWAIKKRDRHAQKEILFALSGKTCYMLNGECYECTPGTIFMIDSFEEHANGYRENEDTLFHLWLMFFKGNTIAALHDLRGLQRNSLRFIVGPLETELLLDIWNDLKVNPDLLSAELKRARILTGISNLLFKVIELSLKYQKTGQMPSSASIIDTIKDHIDETCGNNENIDNLARIAGYSKFHFSRLFKQQTGQTILEYINNCRIRKTKEMLRKFHSKKDIAYTLGFSSPSSFANWYKKNF